MLSAERKCLLSVINVKDKIIYSEACPGFFFRGGKSQPNGTKKICPPVEFNTVPRADNQRGVGLFLKLNYRLLVLLRCRGLHKGEGGGVTHMREKKL